MAWKYEDVKKFYSTTIGDSATYFIKAVESGMWVNWYTQIHEDGKLRFCVVFKMWSFISSILMVTPHWPMMKIRMRAQQQTHV